MNIVILCDDPARTAAMAAALSERTCRLLFSMSDVERAINACAGESVDLILLGGTFSRHEAADLTRRFLALGIAAVLLVGDEKDPGVFAALQGGALGIVAPTRSILGPKLEVLSRRFSARPAPITSSGAAQFPPILAIGASTGGPQALGEILIGLPRPFPAAILIVQHVSSLFTPGFTSWLGSHTGFPVQIAAANQAPRVDEILIAAAGKHLVYRSGGQLSYIDEPRKVSHRPSIDVFFSSLAAGTVRSRLQPGMALLLTGMGRDGAEGLLQLRAAGWTTIAQDEQSSAVYGMPKAAADVGAATSILPLSAMAAQVIRRFSGHGVSSMPELR